MSSFRYLQIGDGQNVLFQGSHPAPRLPAKCHARESKFPIKRSLLVTSDNADSGFQGDNHGAPSNGLSIKSGKLLSEANCPSRNFKSLFPVKTRRHLLTEPVLGHVDGTSKAM